MNPDSSPEAHSSQKKDNNWYKLLKLVKELIKEGNERHFIISNKEGIVLVELTAILAIIIVLAAPVVSAVGLIIALIRGCKITIKRVDIIAKNAPKKHEEKEKPSI